MGRDVFIALAFGAVLVAIAATAPPQRIGDSAEYVAVALNFVAGRGPALSPADRVRLTAQFAEIGGGYEDSQVEFPQLTHPDGSTETPHFWLYPLAASPFVFIADALHLEPLWGFTALNILLLAVAAGVVAHFCPVAVTAMIFLSPIVWWIDKPHYDVAVFALIAVAVAFQRTRPGLAIMMLSLAGAQNPLLAVAWAAFSLWTLIRSRAGADSRAIVGAIAAGAVINAVPLLYYWFRLGVATPLTSFTESHVPALGELSSFLIDPNIGLVWHVPSLVLVVIASWRPLLAALREQWRSIDFVAPVTIGMGLLVGFAQSVNFNHGGTTGPNRWVIWILPAAGVLLARASSLRHGLVVTAGVLLLGLYAFAVHAPATPERYLQPTAPARWLTEHAPWLYNPPLEIFAERTSGREPPILPVATSTCSKIIVWDGWMPAPCEPPATLADACRKSGAWCYLNRTSGGDSTHVVSAPSFHWLPASQLWPAAGPVARQIRDALRTHGVSWQLDHPGSATSPVRAIHSGGPALIVRSESASFVVLPHPTADTTLDLRVEYPTSIHILRLIDGRRLPIEQVVAPGDRISSVALPLGAENNVGVVLLRQR